MNAEYIAATRRNYAAARASGRTDAQYLARYWPNTRDWCGGEVGVKIKAAIVGIELTPTIMQESHEIWEESCAE